MPEVRFELTDGVQVLGRTRGPGTARGECREYPGRAIGEPDGRVDADFGRDLAADDPGHYPVDRAPFSYAYVPRIAFFSVVADLEERTPLAAAEALEDAGLLLPEI